MYEITVHAWPAQAPAALRELARQIEEQDLGDGKLEVDGEQVGQCRVYLVGEERELPPISEHARRVGR